MTLSRVSPVRSLVEVRRLLALKASIGVAGMGCCQLALSLQRLLDPEPPLQTGPAKPSSVTP